MIEFTTSQAFILAFGSIVSGIFMLVRGGDWTIDSAVYLAKKWGLSPLMIGFTVIAFGTSLPEMVVSVFANLSGSGGIAIGNVIGSNIANILLVIGVASMVLPLREKQSVEGLNRDLFMMIGCSFLLIGVLLYGNIWRVMGLGMVLLLVGYIYLQYRMAKQGELKNPMQADEEDHEYSKPVFAYLYLFLGLIVLALGAELLVRGAKVSAGIIGVPEAVIALSVIALGTSLPELSTSIIASKKGHSDIVLGNIIGSNVFNILMILGVTAMVKPIVEGTYSSQLVDIDMWFMLLVSAVFAFLLFFFKRIGKFVGILFFITYLLYNGYIYAIYMG